MHIEKRKNQPYGALKEMMLRQAIFNNGYVSALNIPFPDR